MPHLHQVSGVMINLGVICLRQAQWRRASTIAIGRVTRQQHEELEATPTELGVSANTWTCEWVVVDDNGRKATIREERVDDDVVQVLPQSVPNN